MNTEIHVTRWQFLEMILFVALSTMLAMAILTVMSMDRIASVELVAQESQRHVDEHNVEADEWKNRIVHLEKQMKLVQTSSAARPDPFTGTMGRQLEARIQALENSLLALGSAPALDNLWSPGEEQ